MLQNTSKMPGFRKLWSTKPSLEGGGVTVNHIWLVAYGVSLITLTPTLFVGSSTGMVDISLTLYIDKIAMNKLSSNLSRHFPLI